jgi:hypothetical protein
MVVSEGFFENPINDFALGLAFSFLEPKHLQETAL